MNQHQPAAGPATSGGSGFDERLSTPWWWYLFAAGVAGLLGAEIHMGYPGIRSWIGYAVLIPLAVGIVLRLGSARVRVVDGVLHAGDEQVAVQSIGQVDIVRGRDEKQIALGPDLDPTAHVLLRSWIRPIVRIEITDPASAAPYWVVSVRDADALAAVLRHD